MRTSTVEEQLDPSHWRKLPAIDYQANQFVLSFTCGLVPAALWNTAYCLLGSTEEQQAEGGGARVSRGYEHDEGSRGRD
jgi:hypothetical protein